MNWLNYHHLYYFWTTARLGSISKASDELKLSRPTISAQLQQLQEQMGEELFQKAGRGLELTTFGREVYVYADEIFETGQRLKDFVSQSPSERPDQVTIGISDVMPKLIAYKLLSPLLRCDKNVHLSCAEGSSEQLVADLVLHKVDAIISDVPVSRQVDSRVFHHKLGECGITFFASRCLLPDSRSFPMNLQDLPILLPSKRTAIRRAINLWIDQMGLKPKVVAEFDDSALLKVFGQFAVGAFPAPSIIENEVKKQCHVDVLGRVESIRDSFYLISSQKRLANPYMRRLVETARNSLTNS